MARIIYSLIFIFAFSFYILWSYLFLKIRYKSLLTEFLLVLLYVLSTFCFLVFGNILKIFYDLLMLLYLPPLFYIVIMVFDRIHNKTNFFKKWSFYIYTIVVGGYTAFVSYVLLVGWALQTIFGN